MENNEPSAGKLLNRSKLAARKEKLLSLIESMRPTEKIFFYFFVVLLCASSLVLLREASNLFAVEVPASGGTIKEGVVGYPRYINPILAVSDSGKDLSILVYSGLLKIRTDGTLENDLAESYSVSEDGLTYTVKIKKDAVFHDNTPVTAYDVEYTIKKALDPVIKSPKAPNFAGVSINVVSDKEVQFVLKRPYAPFIENLTLGILPAHVWKDVDSEAFLLSQFNFEPVGSGPYRIKEIKRNSSGLPQYYHMVAFKKYALGAPYIKDIYIYFYTNEDSLIDAFKKGDINTLGSISAEKAMELEQLGANVTKHALPRIIGAFFNQNENRMFADLSVRSALNQATDKQAIIDEALLGFGTPAQIPLPSYLAKAESISPGESQNPEDRVAAAKAILEKAGWKAGEDGVLVKTDSNKSSTRLEFSISTANSPELTKVANILKTQWEKIGAKVTVRPFALPDLQQNAIRPRKYDVLLFGEVINRDADLYAFWHSSERNDPGLNIAMYANQKTDKILSDARTKNTLEERLSLYADFEKEILKDVPAVFLYSPDFIYVEPVGLVNPSLQGITSGSERFVEIENWYLDTDRVWTIFSKYSSR